MADGAREKRGRPRSKGRGGLVIIGVLGLVLAAGGGGAAWFFLLGGKAHLAEKPVPEPAIVSVKPFVVTLRDENKDMHFVQLGIDLDVANPDAVKTVTTSLPEVKDAIRVEVLKHSIADITTPDGIAHLRTALSDTINGAIKIPPPPPPSPDAGDKPASVPAVPMKLVRAIYFSELIVE